MAANTQVISFFGTVNERLLSEMNAKDDLVLRLADGLDVKTSISLLVITFLATQTAYFLDKHTTGLSFWLLVCSGILLGGATIAAFVELWPRTCQLPRPEKSGIDRAKELADFYSQHGDVQADTMIAEFTKNEIEWLQFRISANHKINQAKTKWLEWSFYLTATAMTLNVLVLFMRFF